MHKCSWSTISFFVSCFYFSFFSLDRARKIPFRFRILEKINNRTALFNLFKPNVQTKSKKLSRSATFFLWTLVLSSKLGGEPCIYYDDGEYPHPTSCRKYLVCYKQQAFEALCPSYLWFNDNTKECDSPGNTECSSKLIPLYFSLSFNQDKQNVAFSDSTLVVSSILK